MDYIKEINKLARQAAKVANDRIREDEYKNDKNKDRYYTDWNIVYQDEVDRLVFVAGLRRTRRYGHKNISIFVDCNKL